MFNKEKLTEVLKAYKENFDQNHWNDEKFKWEAIKCFQDNWEINAADFADMLSRSFKKTQGLLASAGNFPARMMQVFAKAAPEDVRAMYISLFDESKDVVARILDFKEQSSIILEKTGNGGYQHYQYENTISTYLWLRYPDKYYIYKYGEVKAVAEELDSELTFKKGAYADNLRNFYNLYDEICEEIKKDDELILLFKSFLTDDCYNDPEYKTLTFDVSFYVSHYYDKKPKTEGNGSNPKPEDENTLVEPKNSDKYTKEDFLNEVYITEDRYNTLTSVLKNKKNIILQGAPGVGKTFAAKRLAYSMMGEKDDSRIEFVQFHQNYSYEDFMMGYKPVEDGFELKYGIFYTFCQKAANNPEKDYFFIIDEINRGNMSKIFGELLMLIERDYRGTEATLAYNGLSFAVPRNLYIIGMMNTADRSLAMIDYALRRRFSFFDMDPGFDSEGFMKYQNTLNNENFSELVVKVQELNREIRLDKSLGKGFCIGHSYFCGQTECTDEWLQSVVEYDILPMLSEYWFDDTVKLQRWENILRGVFND